MWILSAVVPIVMGGGGSPSPHSIIFFNPPSIKTDATPPFGRIPHSKMKPPQLKREAPFHEMIPSKSAINDNLKSG